MDELIKEIKANHEFRKGEGWEQTLLVEDIDVLIQQVEKVPKLEKTCTEYLHSSKYLLQQKEELEREAHTQNAKNKRLEQENQRCKETLKFYANEINYHVFIENGKSNIEHDGGKRARQNLKGEYL
ncbi:hypothetical protein [Oceanobacillus oncorhynchi]|uniref:hypothetical protein n=1 Tax=Oceanobacillus oncorhynchi TaxID=545501 RepID=UPI0034D42B57